MSQQIKFMGFNCVFLYSLKERLNSISKKSFVLIVLSLMLGAGMSAMALMKLPEPSIEFELDSKHDIIISRIQVEDNTIFSIMDSIRDRNIYSIINRRNIQFKEIIENGDILNKID